MAAKVAGSICAAQPVTTMRASGRSRASRRIAWRAWRTASAVTAQVLTMTASSSPASSAARRIASDSTVLSRQPKVTISTASEHFPKKWEPVLREKMRTRKNLEDPI